MRLWQFTACFFYQQVRIGFTCLHHFTTLRISERSNPAWVLLHTRTRHTLSGRMTPVCVQLPSAFYIYAAADLMNCARLMQTDTSSHDLYIMTCALHPCIQTRIMHTCMLHISLLAIDKWIRTILLFPLPFG